MRLIYLNSTSQKIHSTNKYKTNTNFYLAFSYVVVVCIETFTKSSILGRSTYEFLPMHAQVPLVIFYSHFTNLFLMMQLFCSKWYHKASPQDTQYFYIQEKSHDKPFKLPKKIFFQSFSIINNSKTYNSCTLCKYWWNKRWMGTCGKKGVEKKRGVKREVVSKKTLGLASFHNYACIPFYF